MKYVLILIGLFVAPFTYAQQNDGPREVTPAIAKKINAEIEKEIPALLVKLEKNNNERTDKFDESVKFGVDTFKIESFYRKALDYDYSTYGMNKATSDATDKYDSLMNKYYKLLSAKLKPQDKATLLTAQRSWLAYRDNEMKLYAMLRKEEYSAGGTIQSNFMASAYFEIVKDRVLKLFEYYTGIYNWLFSLIFLNFMPPIIGLYEYRF